jgi:sugar lactone lactonase YvrE
VALDGGDGYGVAPKTPAHDARREETWLTADWLPRDESAAIRFDAIRVDASGRVWIEPGPPELQFVAVGPDGALYRAIVSGTRLSLRVTPPPGGPAERLVPLDDAFAAGLDFVQDIQPAADGRVVVTRWSGRVDVVHPDGRVGRVQLPRADPDGIYYTGVVHGDRLCATYCADVTVVCADAP